jgi:4-amino-4-deoxy-L-arabinose transferase-like glycosyltransferase
VTRGIDTNSKTLRYSWFVLAAIAFGLVAIIRIRLLGIPLERDEGEYAYAGQLMLQGIPPYKLAYNIKFPGIYAAYGVIMWIFGQTIAGVHIGLLLVNAAAITLIFFLGRRLMDTNAGIVSAATYALLSASPFVLGLAAHAAHFVILPVLAGTLLLLHKNNSSGFGRLFAAGLLFGVGVMMKQPGACFVPFAMIYLIWRELRPRRSQSGCFVRIVVFTCGVILPFTMTCLLLWGAGVFKQFWFWTIDYAREYGSLVPLTEVPPFFSHRVKDVIGANWALWLFAGIGAVAGLWNQRLRASTVFLLGFLLFSALALSAGLYFRHHYFIFILPAVSLLAGAAISALSDVLAKRNVVGVFALLVLFAASLAFPMVSYKQLFFGVSPVEASRMIYAESPFAEAIKIADYVREHTTSDDAIAVLGSEPEIYFYSGRRSATGYIYTYSLMEPQKYARRMQEEMIREIERAHPKYLLSVAMNDSWLQRPGSDLLIFNWANEYTARNYSAAGFVNMTPTGSDYYFGEMPSTVETLKNYILIYKRNW